MEEGPSRHAAARSESLEPLWDIKVRPHSRAANLALEYATLSREEATELPNWICKWSSAKRLQKTHWDGASYWSLSLRERRAARIGACLLGWSPTGVLELAGFLLFS